jgi:phosphopantetheine adenylyltransferase
MANTKLSKEELGKLQDLQNKNAALIQELGQISLAEINLEQRKESAEQFLEELRTSEQEVVKELEDAYGVGSIDLKEGEFIPAPVEEKGAEDEVVEEVK